LLKATYKLQEIWKAYDLIGIVFRNRNGKMHKYIEQRMKCFHGNIG